MHWRIKVSMRASAIIKFRYQQVFRVSLKLMLWIVINNICTSCEHLLPLSFKVMTQIWFHRNTDKWGHTQDDYPVIFIISNFACMPLDCLLHVIEWRNAFKAALLFLVVFFFTSWPHPLELKKTGKTNLTNSVPLTQ